MGAGTLLIYTDRLCRYGRWIIHRFTRETFAKYVPRTFRTSCVGGDGKQQSRTIRVYRGRGFVIVDVHADIAVARGRGHIVFQYTSSGRGTGCRWRSEQTSLKNASKTGKVHDGRERTVPAETAAFVFKYVR